MFKEIKSSLKDKITYAPSKCGVYLFKDKQQKVIYVGKSRSLKKRLQTYLNPSFDYKSRSIFLFLHDVDYIVTNNEVEALILEANLIKEYKPRYNVLLRDDKNYPYLRLSINEQFPRLSITRRIRNDGARYFGPFRSGRVLRGLMRIISRVFRLRSCSKNVIPGKTPLCLDFHLKRCSGPCVLAIDQMNYGKTVLEVIDFIEGKTDFLINDLKKKMDDASGQLKYEEAKIYRDRLKQLEEIWLRQEVVFPNLGDCDVVSVEKKYGLAAAVIFLVRSGKVIGQRNFTFKISGNDSSEEIYSLLVTQYYRSDSFVPSEIILAQTLENRKIIQQYLEKIRQKKVKITSKGRGYKKEVLQLALSNAKLILEEKLNLKSSGGFKKMRMLQDALNLKTVPRRVEAFDVSNLADKDIVGAKVSFYDGEKDTANYRRYKISFSNRIDDYSAIEEMVSRRFKRALVEQDELPDLVVIDGGRGHLNRACRVLKNFGIANLNIISIAKPRLKRGKGEEKIFLPSSDQPLSFSKTNPVLLFLRRIRDEAHRFALSYQKILRRKHSLALIFAVIFAFSSASFAADLKTKQEELNKIYSELKEKKVKLWQTKQKEKHAMSDLYYVRKQLRQTHGELVQTRFQLAQHEGGIKVLKNELFKSQAYLDIQRKLLADRLLEIYKSSNLDYLEVVFGSSTLSDFVSRSYYFEKIVAKDLDLISSIRNQMQKISQQKNVLEIKKTQTENIAGQIEEKEGFIKVQEKVKDRVLDDLKRKRKEYERTVAELEENSRDIERMIKRLLAERRKEGGKEPLGTGSISWPLHGQIRSYFGYRRHPIFGSVRFHSGLDIDGAYGTSISAADSGKVIFSGWWGGYGKAVIVDHGKGISTVYAHLSRFSVKEGDQVAKGETIGRVGSTGYSTGPHLHFEVRVEGTPVNPMRYLK